MFHRYDYESEYYPASSRVPLDARRKLDLTGVKIALNDWLAFSFAERSVLCHLPCDTAEEQQVVARYLDFLCRHYFGKPAGRTAVMSEDLWGPSEVPGAVADESLALGRPIGLSQWRILAAPQRYALYKTSTSKSQPEAFEQVLRQLHADLANRVPLGPFNG